MECVVKGTCQLPPVTVCYPVAYYPAYAYHRANVLVSHMVLHGISLLCAGALALCQRVPGDPGSSAHAPMLD